MALLILRPWAFWMTAPDLACKCLHVKAPRTSVPGLFHLCAAFQYSSMSRQHAAWTAEINLPNQLMNALAACDLACVRAPRLWGVFARR